METRCWRDGIGDVRWMGVLYFFDKRVGSRPLAIRSCLELHRRESSALIYIYLPVYLTSRPSSTLLNTTLQLSWSSTWCFFRINTTLHAAMTSNADNGVDPKLTQNPSAEPQDPFAGQREPGNDPFEATAQDDKLTDIASPESIRLSQSPPQPKDRRMSKEWDAAKVPPSRFQRREGSIYSTPPSRDAHVKGSERDKAYFDKLREKGWLPSSSK